MTEGVGNARYLSRHNNQMFKEGRSFSGNERDLLWINQGGGVFADLSQFSGADSPNDGRSVVAADFDDDGDVDLFVHELQRERHALYRNEMNSEFGQFIKVRLRATSGQYEAIGAQVTAILDSGKTAQVLSRGAGIASCQVPELIFGVGQAKTADLEVIWPGGHKDVFENVSSGARVLLIEGAEKAEAFAAKPQPLPNPLPAGLTVRIGDTLPNFNLQNASGEEIEFDVKAIANGKPMYLNLWASYCGPCVKEIPDLQAISDEGQITMIGISVDIESAKPRAAKLLESRSASYGAYYLPTAGESGEAAGLPWADLERMPIPTTLVLSSEGVLQRVIRGPIERAE
ncbi:MAG: ASPIC/UnbV domain-containing protein [Planctomycetota bacterium]|nr:ASPIC/UnbV domain-containing protein [Planctomycetota bacterium]